MNTRIPNVGREGARRGGLICVRFFFAFLGVPSRIVNCSRFSVLSSLSEDTLNTKPDSIQFTCLNCKYPNTFTRDEIVQRGKEELYLGNDEVRYSVRCKNPKGCPQHTVVKIKR